jgi:RNA polymerase-binding transcription factor DksA
MTHKLPAARLSSTQRASLEQLIAGERERTAERVTALARDLDAIVEACALTPPDDEHDPEGATLAFERAQVAALLSAARSHLADLERADDRLRSGTYSTCERCDQPIVAERLTARPTARTCVSCAASKAP